MRAIIVAGGRSFQDYEGMKTTLNGLIDRKDENDITIVCGMAKGADLLGKKYAEENGMSVAEFPADWNKHGKSAGYIRNKEMLDFAKEVNGMLVAFWDGYSKGTKQMIDLASKEGLSHKVIMYENEDEGPITSFSGKYEFLRNFYNYPFKYDAIMYTTVEAAFQAQKSSDTKEQHIISKMRPYDAKKYGASMNIDIAYWDSIKVNTMKEILYRKFETYDKESGDNLLKALRNTGERELIEGNFWHDNIWGNCMCPKCKDIEGQNLLGTLLMEVRKNLTNGKECISGINISDERIFICLIKAMNDNIITGFAFDVQGELGWYMNKGMHVGIKEMLLTISGISIDDDRSYENERFGEPDFYYECFDKNSGEKFYAIMEGPSLDVVVSKNINMEDSILVYIAPLQIEIYLSPDKKDAISSVVNSLFRMLDCVEPSENLYNATRGYK